MKYLICLMTLLGMMRVQLLASDVHTVTLKLVETSDVHGCYFPYDFINRKPMKGSLARVSDYVKRLRKEYGENVILMDNGDILQGQPTAYYYNYIDTASLHLNAEMLNYMRYDVGNMGNHDIETGHAVYDRWIRDCGFPVLGANVTDVKTGKPYLPPYRVFEKEGVRIAVLGMITPSIPSWLPERLWSGLRFEDMEQAARKWVDIIREKERPDVLVGLFHSGPEGNKLRQCGGERFGSGCKECSGFRCGVYGGMTMCGHAKRQSMRRAILSCWSIRQTWRGQWRR